MAVIYKNIYTRYINVYTYINKRDLCATNFINVIHLKRNKSSIKCIYIYIYICIYISVYGCI